jgi:hypothetical protein
MKIVNVYDDKWRCGLNVRQLLNPLFFDRDRRHPDMKRQASRRQRARDLRAARALKTRYVPLCAVDPTCEIEDCVDNTIKRIMAASALVRRRDLCQSVRYA